MNKIIHNFDELTGETQERRIQVRKFIAESCELAKKLPPKKKMLFIMRFDYGFSNKEIAELCGCDEETVNRKIKNISKELNDMRNCIKD